VVFLAVVAGDVRNGREEGLQALGRFFWGISNYDVERGMEGCVFFFFFSRFGAKCVQRDSAGLSVKLAMGEVWDVRSILEE